MHWEVEVPLSKQQFTSPAVIDKARVSLHLVPFVGGSLVTTMVHPKEKPIWFFNIFFHLVTELPLPMAICSKKNKRLCKETSH